MARFARTVADCIHGNDATSRVGRRPAQPNYRQLDHHGLAVAIGTPLGILAGTYMAEYGRHTYLTQVVRFINDILLSAPSIVVGLFVYEIMVSPMGHFSGSPELSRSQSS